MWCPEGYISLAEIAASVFVEADNRLWWYSQSVRKEPDPGARVIAYNGPPPDEIQAYTDWLMARFLEKFHREVRAASPSGSVLKISPSMMSIEEYEVDDTDLYRFFPAEREARLTAGRLKPAWVDFQAMSVATQPFPGWAASLFAIAGFPLCISEAAVPKSVEPLVDSILEYAQNPFGTAQEFQDGEQGKQLAQRMIDAWDRGDFTTKAGAWARFGRGRNTEEWRALWSALALARPKVSTPGPRKKSPIR